MTTRMQLGELAVDVVRKDIKHVHLSVHPPTGRITISAPTRMKLDTIRVFAISKLGWIRQQQARLRAQERATPREYLDRESHYVWGRRYLLVTVEANEAPGVELTPSRLRLRVRPGADAGKKQAVLEAWYRDQIRQAMAGLLAKWEPRLGVKLAWCFVQRMKTQWGSCNASARTIRLNSELAKKPEACLEYIVVHELTHLIERHHNGRFVALMDQQIPHWRQRQQELNAAPLAHEDWSY
jgi:predicted metal-dependent hydrolase